MARLYRRVDRDQQFLMPPDMSEWLSDGHLAWFVLEVVDQIDTAVFHRRHPRSGPGRSAYDPEMLLALLVYSYAVGERSSRRIESLCVTDVAFRVICAQDVPDHTTIARFRAVHQDAFRDLFTRVLVLCAQAGMGRVGVVSIDGTKIAANASMGANRGEAWLKEEATRIMAEAAAVDAAEDAQFGDARGDELPPELADPRTRAERIRTALKQVQDKQVDTDATVAAVRAKAEDYLRRVEAGQAPAGRPPEGIDPVRLARARLTREQTRRAEATDAGQRKKAGAALFRIRARLAKAEAQRALEQAVASSRPRQNATTPDGVACDDTAAPVGARAGSKKPRAARANTTDPDSRLMSTKNGWVQGFNAQIAVSDDHLILATTLTQDPTDTLWFEPMMKAAMTAAEIVTAAHPRPDGCPGQSAPIDMFLADAGYLSKHNLTVEGPDRLIALGTNRDLRREAREHPASGPPPHTASPTEQMRHRLRTPEGAKTYKRRGATVEPINGHLKDQIGLRRFSRRGLKSAASELDLAAAAVNLLKLHKRMPAAAG